MVSIVKKSIFYSCYIPRDAPDLNSIYFELMHPFLKYMFAGKTTW